MAGLTKTFDSPDEPLHDRLKPAQPGKAQLTLRADDFAAFYEARKRALLARIAETIGKALEDEVDEAAVASGAGAGAAS